MSHTPQTVKCSGKCASSRSGSNDWSRTGVKTFSSTFTRVIFLPKYLYLYLPRTCVCHLWWADRFSVVVWTLWQPWLCVCVCGEKCGKTLVLMTSVSGDSWHFFSSYFSCHFSNAESPKCGKTLVVKVKAPKSLNNLRPVVVTHHAGLWEDCQWWDLCHDWTQTWSTAVCL